MLDDSVIDRLKEIILSVVSAKRIILFGSQATGTDTDDSDIDVLVIVDDITKDLRRIRQTLHVQIATLVALPCDVLVEHERAFFERSTLPTLERTISRTGMILYAA